MPLFGRIRNALRDLRALRDTVAHIEHDIRALSAQQKEGAAATEQALAALKRDLERVNLHETQLRAIARADLQLDDRRLQKLEATLADPHAIGAHVCAAIGGAELHLSPFPYMVVDDVLPEPVFRALITGLPPAVLFADKPVNHQHLEPPFELASVYSRRIWGFMVDVLVDEFIQPAVLKKLTDPVDAWFRGHFPGHTEGAASLRLTTSSGRVLLRKRGYRIPPHRDPKWAVVTCLLYLPRRGDDERWGTQLYTVAEDAEASGAKPHWIDPARCTLVAEVAFRPNRLLVFVNSVGAHGAYIPDDAEPADLERYAYQFRIGPDAASMTRLVATLPDDRKALWAGKAAADY